MEASKQVDQPVDIHDVGEVGYGDGLGGKQNGAYHLECLILGALRGNGSIEGMPPFDDESAHDGRLVRPSIWARALSGSRRGELGCFRQVQPGRFCPQAGSALALAPTSAVGPEVVGRLALALQDFARGDELHLCRHIQGSAGHLAQLGADERVVYRALVPGEVLALEEVGDHHGQGVALLALGHGFGLLDEVLREPPIERRALAHLDV